jgi:hypothetical protein
MSINTDEGDFELFIGLYSLLMPGKRLSIVQQVIDLKCFVKHIFFMKLILFEFYVAMFHIFNIFAP